jgi:hypothetical protein
MKLIIAQMRNQNPLEPQKDSDFMAQMAQFEALNQMKLVAQGMKVLQGVNDFSSAAASPQYHRPQVKPERPGSCCAGEYSPLRALTSNKGHDSTTSRRRWTPRMPAAVRAG